MMGRDGILTLFNMSITGGAVIAVILVLRLFMRRLPKRYLCLLWLIPFIRLLVPAAIPSPVSLLPVNTHPVTTVEMGNGNELPFLNTGLSYVDNAVNFIILSNFGQEAEESYKNLPEGAAGNSDGQKDSVWIEEEASNGLLSAAGVIWAFGVCLFAVGNGIRYRKLKKATAEAVPGGDGAYYSDVLDMPIVLGIVKPRILLPSMFLKEENSAEKEFILAHEAAHIRRRDYLTKLLAFVVLAIHWFNPLVWAAYLLLCRDMEMACDEAVMETLGEEKKKGYSLALLQFEERRSALFMPLAFGESNTKSRIKNILNYKKPKFWMGLLAVLLLGAAAVTLLTDPEGYGSSIGIIGGADGPTAIFIGGKVGGGTNGPAENMPSGGTGEEGNPAVMETDADGDGQDASTAIIGGADGPTSIFLAGKLDGENAVQAENMDLERVLKENYGTSVELDYVSAGRFSMHGYFGYLSFGISEDENGEPKAELLRAATFSEAGPLEMQGDSYTEIIGGEGSAVIVTNAYNRKEEKRLFFYMEEENVLEEQTGDGAVKEQILESLEKGELRDAYLEDDGRELRNLLRMEHDSGLVYGPVAIPEFNSNTYAFLGTNGPNVENIWYGIWNRDMGTVTRINLFPK